jgi:peptide/nickel transport system permease protein
VSLLVGILTVLISTFIGTTLGAIAGYYRGLFDIAISRLADLLLSFPFLIFTVGAMAMLGPGFWNLILALTFKSWVEFYRLVRGEVLREKTREYVEAAQAAGQKDPGIIIFEILPNIIHSITVLGTLRIGYMIIMEASLSYLGLGIPPEIPAWGSMINSGRNHMFNAYWISTLPGLALVLLVLSINLFGEGLRDILDPRLKIE